MTLSESQDKKGIFVNRYQPLIELKVR